MRGRILTHLAGPPESSGDAVMLTSDNNKITGLAWAFLDETCRLHYNIRLEGSDSLDNAEPSLELEDYPIHKSNNLKAMPLFPSTKRHLQDCRGSQCVGHADSIHKLMLARLDSGDAAFLMSNQGPDSFDIKVWNSINCSPHLFWFDFSRAYSTESTRPSPACPGTPGTTWRSSPAT